MREYQALIQKPFNVVPEFEDRGPVLVDRYHPGGYYDCDVKDEVK